MATRRIRISPAGNQFDVLGESPVWCPQDGSIYWIDWAMNVIRRMRSRDGALTEWKMKEKVGSFALRQSRGAILAMQSGFHLFDFESADTTFIANPNPAGIRHGLNDGKCDRAGRFWAGSIVAPLAELTSDSEPGFLFCLDGNLRSRKAYDGILICNGIAWSPDARTIYFGDSGRRVIFRGAFDLDDGVIHEVSVLCSIEGTATPDGSTVDADGCLWNARYGGGQLVRYEPTGRIVETIPLPVTHPTSCIFGGENLDQLYVTTSRWRLSEKELAEQPLAGRLLVLDVGRTGLPETQFAG